ncbi:hypothetical protein B2G71_13405 [Novosphingobium sp. PC22D]|uniref:hypothetical protein n=1 Tax=Novosphingobium sp. PC22D TaxID=1962403 RepID=UPI000BEF6CCC|nr:hypothetical protein [Novosphingobium sp. PC22D]PEQ12134.1 hypothetical protein B2G71_13405 [Novosphingobium sp. PC22D]
MLFSLLAASALAKLDPQAEADLRCMAVFAVAASQNEEPDAGSIGAIMYYLGRLEGRTVDFNFQTYLLQLLNSSKYTVEVAQADAERCGKEMSDKASQLEVVGRMMQGGSESGGH